MSLKISAKTCLQLLKASIAITDYRTKEIVTKPGAGLSKHNKYAIGFERNRHLLSSHRQCIVGVV